jgi:hypothetical protein
MKSNKRAPKLPTPQSSSEEEEDDLMDENMEDGFGDSEEAEGSDIASDS